jgi:hypothetical protein
MPVAHVCTRPYYNLLMPIVWQGSVAQCSFDTCMRLLAQLANQRFSVCMNSCRYLCWNFVSCVMFVFLLLKCGTALNFKTGRGGNEGVWQSLWSVTMTKGLPHFHRCLHKYNRLAIIRLYPGFNMDEPEQGSATRAVQCMNITSSVSSVSCDVMQSREQWIRKCVCIKCRLCIVHNC